MNAGDLGQSHRILNNWIPRCVQSRNKDNPVQRWICASGWRARCSFNRTVRLISSWPLETSWRVSQLGYLQSCIPTSFSDSQISLIPSTSSGMCIPDSKRYLLLDLGVFKLRVFGRGGEEKEAGWCVRIFPEGASLSWHPPPTPGHRTISTLTRRWHGRKRGWPYERYSFKMVKWSQGKQSEVNSPLS